MSKLAMPTWVEPQLATLTRERFSSPDWIFERKLDGERCLAFADSGGVRLLSRSQHDITRTFPATARRSPSRPAATTGRAWSPSGPTPPTPAPAAATG